MLCDFISQKYFQFCSHNRLEIAKRLSGLRKARATMKIKNDLPFCFSKCQIENLKEVIGVIRLNVKKFRKTNKL